MGHNSDKKRGVKRKEISMGSSLSSKLTKKCTKVNTQYVYTGSTVYYNVTLYDE